MRVRRVLGESPRILAAPSDPSIFQPVASLTAAMYSRSTSARVLLSLCGDGAGNVSEVTRVITTDDFGEADPAEIAPRAPEDPAALLYTGGTTGRAKGVLLSHENLWFAGKSGHDAGHLPEITRGLLALPL